MIPVSFGGSPLEPPVPLGPPADAPVPSTPASDTVRLDGTHPVGFPILRPTAAAPDPVLVPSPRPWPPPPGDLPAATSWAVLSARAPAEVAAAVLTSGAVGAALVPSLETQTKKAPRQPRVGLWDAEPTGAGWRVPRNSSRVPVKPGSPFEVREGTDDLGPLHIVSTMVGRIRALRLQWPEEYVEPAYGAQKAVLHDVATRLPSDVTLHVVAEGLSASTVRALLDEWGVAAPERIHVHALHLHSTPEQLYCPLTMWARDGAVLMRTEDGREVLLLPHSFRGDTQVATTLNRRVVQGTGAAPASLQRALPELIVRRSRLIFEGGDLIASRRAVLVGSESVAASMAALRLPREAVVERFTQELGRPIVVVAPQPEFHLDLGFTFLDDDTVAVGDPRMASRLGAGVTAFAPMIAASQEKGLADKYDAAAASLRAFGYKVVRLPNLAGRGLTTPYLTYNNVLMENFTGAGKTIKRVYMPVYDAPLLDELARDVYRAHRYTVVDMPSARQSTLLWGAIRCATGELQVGE